MAGNRQMNSTLRQRSPRARHAIGLRRWREGKVRPIPGNPPHDRPVSRGISSSFQESLRRSLPHHLAPQLHRIILGAQYAFSKAWRNLSGPMWSIQKQKQNQTPGRSRAASRRSAPSLGRRTRREDHALAHRPQMSSGRLILDRVARQHCPSPLHRHAQITTQSSSPPAKPELSTLLETGTFYFALTPGRSSVVSRVQQGVKTNRIRGSGANSPVITDHGTMRRFRFG
jgi:hypothetical protein